MGVVEEDACWGFQVVGEGFVLGRVFWEGTDVRRVLVGAGALPRELGGVGWRGVGWPGIVARRCQQQPEPRHAWQLMRWVWAAPVGM